MPWSTQFFVSIPSKISVVMYFQMESYYLENQTQAIKRNVQLHNKLSNDIYMQESIKVSNNKLTMHTLNSLQILIFVITW